MRALTATLVAAAAALAAAQPGVKVIPAVKPTLAGTPKPIVKFVNPPDNVTLNTRDVPIVVGYANVPEGETMDVHVDLIGDGGYTWFGGGMGATTGTEGEVTVPIEVRVPSYYGGTLSMHAFLTPKGGNFEQRVATADEKDVGIDRTPTNAVGILCQPRAVKPGSRFVVNLWFTQTHPRESDFIAVALHADSKEYFGGCQHEIKEQQGHISCDFDLKAAPLDAPLKFKAWISPRGEKAPNYVSYTMINLPLAAETVQPCNPIPNNEWTQTGLPEANWVELHDAPKSFQPGDNLKLRLKYNLVPAKKEAVTATVALMTWDWKTHGSTEVVATKVKVAPVFDEAIVPLAIPKDALNGPDGVYFIALLDNLAEDRVYETKMVAPGLAEVEVGPAGLDAHVVDAAVTAAAKPAAKVQDRVASWLRKAPQ